jgi:hypothetical protein
LKKLEANFDAPLAHFTDTALWSSHVQVPLKIASQFINAGVKRVECTLNHTHTFQCAIMPHGDNYHFLFVNKPTAKKLKLNLGENIHVHIAKDESEYGLPMEEEFKAVLEQDPDFDAYFHKLTPGKQRNLLHLISIVKSSDIRIRKSLVIADHLKANKGVIDFKKLHEAFKNK